MKILNIPDFINKSEDYTKENFPNLDINELLQSAISGKVNNKTIYSSILSLFGKEVISTLRILANVLLIIVIHSLLKSVSENMGNGGVSKITYYVEYILIVTLVLVSFSEIISVTKQSIQNLVGFSYSLFPILLALLASTRKYYICFCCTTYYTRFYYIYKQYYSKYYYTNFANRNCSWNYI